MSPAEVLRSVMLETSTTQSSLARYSGVRQPTISQILAGRIGVSDEQLQRLLTCMGYELHVIRKAERPTLTRSERRSWRLHRQISSHLTRDSLVDWRPIIRRNLSRLESNTQGEPHAGNIHEWRRLVDMNDVLGVHRLLTGLDRHSIEMREVSPFGGVLSEEERLQVLRQTS